MKYLLLLFCMGVSFHSGKCFSNEKLCEDGIKAVSLFGDGQWKNFLGKPLNGPCYPLFFYIDKKKVSRDITFISLTGFKSTCIFRNPRFHMQYLITAWKKTFFTDTDHLLCLKYEFFHLVYREAVVQRCYYVKSAQIQSFFWSVLSCFQAEYREIRNIVQKNSVFGLFSLRVFC